METEKLLKILTIWAELTEKEDLRKLLKEEITIEQFVRIVMEYSSQNVGLYKKQIENIPDNANKSKGIKIRERQILKRNRIIKKCKKYLGIPVED